MCLKLRFDTDISSPATNMALYLVLMQGRYDAILHWPFEYRATFSVFDGTSFGNASSKSVWPNSTSSGSQRPSTSSNIVSGIPDFMPLDLLEQNGNQYVHDDTMFIKVFVDFIIPYMACSTAVQPDDGHHADTVPSSVDALAAINNIQQ